jgi:hypothetical protein
MEVQVNETLLTAKRSGGQQTGNEMAVKRILTKY